jgi:hypothetical protein
MAEKKLNNDSAYTPNDSFDINELAALNEDISPEFLEQLQNQVAQNALNFSDNNKIVGDDDSELFEEVSSTTPTSDNISQIEIDKLEPEQDSVKDENKSAKLDESIDDNFIKKYKAKLNKLTQQAKPEDIEPPVQSIIPKPPKEEKIEDVTSGNIIEKQISKEQISYNDSLDYLDDKIKYKKYVIYIDPENTDFIESLTVKERKNLINKILKEQGDIAITKKRFAMIQTLIKHSVVAILTIAIAIPVIYYTINVSLETSVNNYRRSQTLFSTLYKEQGRIKKN